MIAVEAEPSAIAGSTSWAGVPAPELGSQPSVTENSSISISPSQKTGIETPISAISVARLSQSVYRLVAETTPAISPTTIETANDATASSAVGPTRLAISSTTGRLVT